MNWVIGQETTSGGFKQVLCIGTGRIPAVLVAQTSAPGTHRPAAGIHLRARFQPCKPQPRWTFHLGGSAYLPKGRTISLLPRPQGLISGIASIKSLYTWGPELPASHLIELRGRCEAGDWSRAPATKTMCSPISREAFFWSDSSRVVFSEKPKLGFCGNSFSQEGWGKPAGLARVFGWAGDVAVAQGEPALPHMGGKR